MEKCGICLVFWCCFRHSVCHCWGNILVFGALLSVNKRDGIKLSFWALNGPFFPLLIFHSALIEVLSSIFPALCFCSVNTFFDFYSEKSGQAQRNARYSDWMSENQHNAWSVKLSRDWKINNVCFYCREWYQCAQELCIILLANMVPRKQLYSAKLADFLSKSSLVVTPLR